MKVSGWLAKVAVAVVSAPRVNVQLGFVLPAQGPPVQLAKRAVVGEANRVIEVPDAKLAVHVAPQAIAAGELATLPVPPFWTLVTVSVNVPDGEGGGASEVLKVALTGHVVVDLDGARACARAAAAAPAGEDGSR